MTPEPINPGSSPATREVTTMTHRTVAPSSDTYEIRLYWHHEGRKYKLGTVKDGSPKRTRRLFQTVEKAPAPAGADLYVAELYNLEQEYAHQAQVTDVDTLERLSLLSIETLLERAEQVQ